MAKSERAYWIGLSFNLGKYIWPDGSLPTEYINWQTGYPDARGCVIMRKDNGKWQNRPCREKFHHVCEYRAPGNADGSAFFFFLYRMSFTAR